MRITDSLLQNTFLTNLNNTKNSLAKVQRELTTQKKINVVSDSPAGSSRVMRLSAELQDITSYMENINNGKSFIQSSISSMEGIQSEIQATLIDFASLENAIADGSLVAAGEKLELALDSIIDLANSKFAGKHLFGGTDNSQEPYGINGTPPPNIQQNTADTSGEVKVKISATISQKINITGDELFGTIDGTDIFNTIYDIKESLKSGVKATSAQIKIVEDFNEKIISVISQAGNGLNRLDNTSEILQTQELELRDIISKELDVDIAQAVIDMENQQFALNIAYKSSSMILPKSLLDFL